MTIGTMNELLPLTAENVSKNFSIQRGLMIKEINERKKKEKEKEEKKDFMEKVFIEMGKMFEMAMMKTLKESSNGKYTATIKI